MPIYEYRCSACGHEMDALQKMSEPKLLTCPACHADALVKKVSAAGFQLKGSGWYVTDFRNGSKGATAPKKDAGGDAAAKGDTATASDSKGDAGKTDTAKADSKSTESSSAGTPAAKSESAPAASTPAPVKSTPSSTA